MLVGADPNNASCGIWGVSFFPCACEMDPLPAALLQKVARADLAETANQRCLSSKVKPAQVSMAGEAYQ